jgi:hypothetical protein
MEYLYHRVPDNLKGTILYPLNILKETEPEIYKDHVKKYEGREKILETKIPPLDCLWNDVLHFTAVSPKELKANLAKAGIVLPSVKWFKVPVSMIEEDRSIAFIYRRDLSVTPNFDEYEKFDPSRMDTYRKVPEGTIDYYRKKKDEGQRPLLFHLVPHILYKGSINIEGLEILSS